MAISKDMLDAMEVMRRVDGLLAAVSINEARVADSPAYCLDKLLDLAGIKTLGSGHFGCTVKCGTVVLKISIDKSDGYQLFVDYADKNPGRGIVRIMAKGKTDRMFWTVLPVLNPMTDVDKLRSATLRNNGESYLAVAHNTMQRELASMARWDCRDDNIMYDPELGEYVITDPLAHVTFNREQQEHDRDGVSLIKQHVAEDLWSMPEPVTPVVLNERAKAFADDIRAVPAGPSKLRGLAPGQLSGLAQEGYNMLSYGAREYLQTVPHNMQTELLSRLAVKLRGMRITRAHIKNEWHYMMYLGARPEARHVGRQPNMQQLPKAQLAKNMLLPVDFAKIEAQVHALAQAPLPKDDLFFFP